MKPSAAVDALGRLRAKMAEMELDDKRLCALLKESGMTNIMGKEYEAKMVPSTKSTLDMKFIRYTLTPEFLADHTKSTPYVAVRVTEIKPRSKA